VASACAVTSRAAELLYAFVESARAVTARAAEVVHAVVVLARAVTSRAMELVYAVVASARAVTSPGLRWFTPSWSVAPSRQGWWRRCMQSWRSLAPSRNVRPRWSTPSWRPHHVRRK
jgi:hypothetical protein